MVCRSSSSRRLKSSDVVEIEQREKAIRQKLDRLDEAFLFAQSIDIETYDRHKDKLRQELTLLEIDRHADMLEKFDVDASWRSQNAFYRARRTLWVQASARSAPAFSAVVFPDEVVFDGKRFVRTSDSTPVFKYLTSVEPAENNLASPTGFEPVFWP